MADLIHKIGDKLGMGGDHKDGEDKNKKAGYSGGKKEEGHGGIMDKVKDKIHGGEHKEGESKDKKKKKDKKDKKDKKHGGDSSSDSDSD